jgi:LysR family transcriptional regulator of abg operon
MNFHQLRQFLAVAECGSFRQAGKKLNISQSAITKSIKMLEIELGVELITRGSAGSVVTVFGLELLPTAKLITRQILDATDRIKKRSLEGRGRVAMGAGATTDEVLPDTISAFKRRYPDTALEVCSGMPPSLLPRLLDGSLDFMFGPKEGFEIPPSIISESLFTSENLVVVRRGHPLESAKSLEQFQNVEWILAPMLASADSCLGQTLQKIGMGPARVTILSDLPSITERLVQNSNYVSVFRRSLLTSSGRPPVVAVPVIEAPLIDEVCLFTRRSGTGSPLADRFLELLRAQIQSKGKQYRWR